MPIIDCNIVFQEDCGHNIDPLVSGTMMMSGSGILTNGKGTRREYGDFNLDELQVSLTAMSR
jgi:hypothetical protein